MGFFLFVLCFFVLFFIDDIVDIVIIENNGVIFGKYIVWNDSEVEKVYMYLYWVMM